MNRFHFDVEALFISIDLSLEITLICHIIVLVLMEHLIYVGDSVLDILCRRHELFSQLLDGLQATTGSLQDGLGDEHVCVTHELLILAHLRVEQVGEDVTCDHFILLTGHCCSHGCLGLSFEFPVCALGTEAETTALLVILT